MLFFLTANAFSNIQESQGHFQLLLLSCVHWDEGSWSNALARSLCKLILQLLLAQQQSSQQPTSYLLDFQDKGHLTASVSCDCRELLLSSVSGLTSYPIETRLEVRSRHLPLSCISHPILSKWSFKNLLNSYILMRVSCPTGSWPPALNFLHDCLFLNSLWHLIAWSFGRNFPLNILFKMETNHNYWTLSLCQALCKALYSVLSQSPPNPLN